MAQCTCICFCFCDVLIFLHLEVSDVQLAATFVQRDMELVGLGRAGTDVLYQSPDIVCVERVFIC